MRKITLKYTLLSLVLSCALVITSCNEWLNVSPKADMKADDLFSTQEGFRDALIGVYASMSTEGMYGKKMTYGYLDILAQYYESPHTASNHSYKKAAQYKYSELTEELRISELWNEHYKAIANINLALESIDLNKSVFSNEQLHSTYKGEFLALRAMLHFNVLRTFASSPKMNGGSGVNTLAIPYVEGYTNQAQAQLTVGETLNKIEADLVAAKSFLKDKELYGSIGSPQEIDLPEMFRRRNERMNYWATTALLARVYLYAGKNSEALKQAKEVIGEANGTNPTAFEMANNPSITDDPMFRSEILFALDVQKLKKLTEEYFLDTRETTYTILSVSNEAMKIMFDGTELDNDFRLPWLSITSDNSSSILKKYNGMQYIPMFKLSELYLIAAETAPQEEGTTYLNKLRFHRGLGEFNPSDGLSKSIYKEYKREFIGEGQLFFFYKRNAYKIIGAADNYPIGDAPETIYNLPIPIDEQDFGNIKK